MNCIFCLNTVKERSLEHIVPESLGNLYYILEMGSICRQCNNSFSEFEEKALGKTMLGFERSRMGIPTKKGKAAQAKSRNIKFTGDPAFRKNFINISGLEQKDIEEIGEDGTIKVKIIDFDKSDMATSKLILKIGLESLFQSQRRIYNSYDFSELRDHLNKVNNNNWPILTTKEPLEGFISVPRFMDKKRLKDIRCEILYKCIDKENALLQFKYTVLSYVVNLSSRDIKWAIPYLERDKMAMLYPEHLRKKVPL